MTNPKQALQPSRKELLAKLESIVGEHCYNGNIRNFSGDTQLDDGSWFRYPVTAVFQGKPEKWKNLRVGLIEDSDFVRAHYSFGANQLFIIYALDELLTYLEQNHGLTLPQDQAQ